jgi:cupin-like protein
MFEDAAPVDVALAPSVEEFAERYVRRERPVIVRGAVKDWPPSYKWTPEYLKAMYGTRGVKIGIPPNGNGDYLDDAERLNIGVEREVAFAKTIDDIFAPADPEQKCRIDKVGLKAWAP